MKDAATAPNACLFDRDLFVHAQVCVLFTG